MGNTISPRLIKITKPDKFVDFAEVGTAARLIRDHPVLYVQDICMYVAFI